MTKKNKIILFVLLAVIALLALFSFGQVFGLRFGFGGNFVLFNSKGVIALQEHKLIVIMFVVMLLAVVPAYFCLFYFASKYRADKNSEYNPNLESRGGSALLLWVLPVAVIFSLSFLNWTSTHALDPAKQIASPNKPLTIQVVALEWKFLFIYPAQNIATVNFIEFPVNTPVHFELTADAPMSSFWIPQLGSQIYAMAAMQTQINLIASQTGDFAGKNTEINGAGFSGMKFVARSASLADFNSWLQSVKSSLADLNLDAYNRLAAPSQNNPAAAYASVDPGLYDTVMMKNMMPMTDQQMRQMSSTGMASSSATDMQSMDMGTSPPMNMTDMPGMQMK